ncbi:hypothetical protein CANTEDRAFT_116071 [Yamadazyma tenuis ATCC 10573]|uniref:GAF domain-containing protein n=1 Tax=Candida tenuis (strain ATCC 10573 / BCRC 21748 / CBS 615 / JCM 9827 / NBRC 10315 / NRRL Y-1498 / VKM Y-70) TaxID=590646 RepID=G3BFL2_CANTC|nr:uncharacterized protein CANTEDRAFT_116071 [Yamadazyma tenuis ATCC 10573]EGV60042.1 hypothetical protein CANTEDRAFT_116071 [Yamadazyma tenuis ATCC 10573]
MLIRKYAFLQPSPQNQIHTNSNQGKWNLSEIPKPKCVGDVRFMKPPECYIESSRAKVVNEYTNLKQWDEKPIFKKIISRARKQFNVSGVSISIVNSKKVVFKYESLLNASEVSRPASIDGHAIVSQDYFLLLDASKDWRTTSNPFVDGIPYIRFYCGVPLMAANRKDIVGVVAIFDSFPRKSFSNESITILKQLSSEITQVLNTPIEDMSLKYKNVRANSKYSTARYDEKMTELHELQIKLGRATSRGSLMTVFEKDGPGGPYSQNNNFKFLTKLTDEAEQEEFVNNNSLFEKLMKTGTIKRASNLLCKILSVNYKADFVYILEIRIAESYEIESKYFPKENKIESDSFAYANKLVKRPSDKNEFMSRIMGCYGSTHTSLNFENLIHHKCFEAEFGIHYKTKTNSSIYNVGVLMPFYRHSSKMVRQKKLRSLKGDKNPKTALFLRSGGYIVGLFNKEGEKKFDDQTISKVFNNVSVMRKLYISG